MAAISRTVPTPFSLSKLLTLKFSELEPEIAKGLRILHSLGITEFGGSYLYKLGKEKFFGLSSSSRTGLIIIAKVSFSQTGTLSLPGGPFVWGVETTKDEPLDSGVIRWSEPKFKVDFINEKINFDPKWVRDVAINERLCLCIPVSTLPWWIVRLQSLFTWLSMDQHEHPVVQYGALNDALNELFYGIRNETALTNEFVLHDIPDGRTTFDDLLQHELFPLNYKIHYGQRCGTSVALRGARNKVWISPVTMEKGNFDLEKTSTSLLASRTDTPVSSPVETKEESKSPKDIKAQIKAVIHKRIVSELTPGVLSQLLPHLENDSDLLASVIEHLKTCPITDLVGYLDKL